MNQIPVVDGTKEKLFQEFTSVISETEQLIKSVAGAGTDKAGAIKANVQQGLADAGERLARIREDASTQAAAAARAADEYVRDNPWRSVGIVAASAALAGLVAGMLIARR
jgi:ElaB/YqjD/DUF883 family membrane-anchored ribosome-binding protein